MEGLLRTGPTHACRRTVADTAKYISRIALWAYDGTCPALVPRQAHANCKAARSGNIEILDLTSFECPANLEALFFLVSAASWFCSGFATFALWSEAEEVIQHLPYYSWFTVVLWVELMGSWQILGGLHSTSDFFALIFTQKFPAIPYYSSGVRQLESPWERSSPMFSQRC